VPAIMPMAFHKIRKAWNAIRTGVSKNPAIQGMKKPFHFERVHTIVLKGFI